MVGCWRRGVGFCLRDCAGVFAFAFGVVLVFAWGFVRFCGAGRSVARGRAGRWWPARPGFLAAGGATAAAGAGADDLGARLGSLAGGVVSTADSSSRAGA
ncbi:hypothetical protein ACFYOG_35605 [Streptomyces sp. NPDC007818]|uniref:hypothetical protein n=1 Tax=Streptomyces sp. NPDC007818 TaxID=3364780 RepID=UPI00369110CE